MNTGGVRADLTGDITVGDAYTALPISLTLVSLSILGQSLLNLPQSNVLNDYFTSGVTFTYVSNVRFLVDLSNPVSPVVADVMVKDSGGTFMPIHVGAQ